MNKKGQGLSMNVIIIAAISLIVLVIISVLVLRAGGNVNQNTGCEGVNGRCVESCMALEGSWIKDPAHGCENEYDTCCIPLGNNN